MQSCLKPPGMIGRLQTNKVKDVVGQVKLIHSLDRWKLAEELEKRGLKAGVQVPALIEVNISGKAESWLPGLRGKGGTGIGGPV